MTSLQYLEVMNKGQTRNPVAKGQHPYAIIVACSDSRVPPEILFDTGLGEIFVIRVAGNVVASHELGSIEYAAEHLGSSLVMVLGHERCGAATATVDAKGKSEGNIGSLVQSIAPAVKTARKKNSKASNADLVESSISENVKLVAQNIQKQSKVKIVGAKCDFDEGTIQVVDLHKVDSSGCSRGRIFSIPGDSCVTCSRCPIIILVCLSVPPVPHIH